MKYIWQLDDFPKFKYDKQKTPNLTLLLDWVFIFCGVGGTISHTVYQIVESWCIKMCIRYKYLC